MITKTKNTYAGFFKNRIPVKKVSIKVRRALGGMFFEISYINDDTKKNRRYRKRMLNKAIRLSIK